MEIVFVTLNLKSVMGVFFFKGEVQHNFYTEQDEDGLQNLEKIPCDSGHILQSN